MGRGRQKAKQTKVARKLKYYTPDTDYRALERELSTGGESTDSDPYADYYEDDDDVADQWSDLAQPSSPRRE
jgi:hypothetical protein